jgi:hypothetical protein
MLDRINTKATPQAILSWKSSAKTKRCYKLLHRKIDPDNSDETYFARILARAWPAKAPTNMELVFTLTVCQIVLSDHYEKLVVSDSITHNRINKNIVSNI